ncbi:hypothetical protein D9756_000096 [Leucocoprinus leucothites]|uniref:F-box domain-containing protein n=1 Tax=Leucocoprinus leucothites TaxID=201217 RepID=A0A8H5GF82_9AGAR|nr:hypothetical protein D9756_000096 [Leucoagaricus leucothites]
MSTALPSICLLIPHIHLHINTDPPRELMEPSHLKEPVAQVLSISEDIYLDSKDQCFLDAEIAHHESLLHSLAQRIATLKNHRNSLSRTWLLPIEVIGKIMLMATQLSIKEMNESEVYPPPLHQRIPVPLVVGQVCSAWRSLAWRLPELWATIPLAISRSCYEKQILLLDDWLDRAGDIQDLYIILTLAHDDSELQYFRDYPPKAVLEKLYKRSNQWHTFYSTLPNLCFQDLFKDVYRKLERLDTLVLNRSGRLAFEQAFNIGNGNVVTVTGGINNLGGGGGIGIGAAGGPNVVVQPGPGGVNVIQNGVFVNGIMVNGGGGGAHIPPNNPAMVPINITTTNSSPSSTSTRHKSPWFMLSSAPLLRTVILPESLSPIEVPLPWTNITHLELRTVPLDDCLKILSYTSYIASFNFQGIFSSSASNMMSIQTFFHAGHGFGINTHLGGGHGYGGGAQRQKHLRLPELRKFSVFSDPINLTRFMGSLIVPRVYALEFKCTTGSITNVLNEITRLGERSGWAYDHDNNDGTGLRKLGIYVPSVGQAEELIMAWLMGDTSVPGLNAGGGEWGQGRMGEVLEELVLESWQADVEGLSDKFLVKMNPERRVRCVKTFSYELENPPPSLSGVQDSSAPVPGSTSSSNSTISTISTTSSANTSSSGSSTREPGIVAPGWVDVPTDEIREPIEQLVQVPQGEFVQPHEILLPNLVAMTYRGTLSFNPRTLKEMIYARWRRMSRKRSVPKLIRVGDASPVVGVRRGEVGMGEYVIMEDEEYFPTVELKAFDVSAPDMEDFKEPIDEETNLVFRQMLREGFCLSVETKRGLLAF